MSRLVEATAPKRPQGVLPGGREPLAPMASRVPTGCLRLCPRSVSSSTRPGQRRWASPVEMVNTVEVVVVEAARTSSTLTHRAGEAAVAVLVDAEVREGRLEVLAALRWG